MTDDEILSAFEHGLTLLDVDDDGLTPDNVLADLNTLAMLCRPVKAITAAGDSPEQLVLHRLAMLTEDLIATWVLVGGKAAVREWLLARAELLQLRMPIV